MKSQIWVSLAAFVAALVIIGCGGGGGGGTSGGGPGGGGGETAGGGATKPQAGQYIEFIGSNRTGNLNPLQLQVGDDVQLQVVNYDPAGARTILNGTGWTTTAPVNLVALGSNGRLTILGRASGLLSVTVRVTVAGSQKTIQQDFAVQPAGATSVSGRVVEEDTSVGLEYVQVNFYDASGAAVAGTRTSDNGVYSASIPSTVKSASIKASTVKAPPFYRSFTYGGKIYTMDASTCPLKLPNLKTGQNNALGNMTVFRQENGPPPPPDGCKP